MISASNALGPGLHREAGRADARQATLAGFEPVEIELPAVRRSDRDIGEAVGLERLLRKSHSRAAGRPRRPRDQLVGQRRAQPASIFRGCVAFLRTIPFRAAGSSPFPRRSPIRARRCSGQQLDRLRQLRGQHQLLRLPDLDAWTEAHGVSLYRAKLSPRYRRRTSLSSTSACGVPWNSTCPS
jgi:hypothetical protein